MLAFSLVVVLGGLLGLGDWIPRFGDISADVGVVAGLLMVAAMFICRAWEPRVLGRARTSSAGCCGR